MKQNCQKSCKFCGGGGGGGGGDGGGGGGNGTLQMMLQKGCINIL